MKHRLESRQEGRFWEVVVHGGSVTVHHGPVGAQGHYSERHFGDTHQAMVHAEALLQDRLNDGYELVDWSHGEPAAPGTASIEESMKGLAQWAQRESLAMGEPVPEGHLVAVERVLGYELPADLRGFLLRAGLGPELPWPAWSWVSLDHALVQRKRDRLDLLQGPDGERLAVDRKGSVFLEGVPEARRLGSVRQWLAALVQELETPAARGTIPGGTAFRAK
jgi:predicted DNA-binding WGR domain protein